MDENTAQRIVNISDTGSNTVNVLKQAVSITHEAQQLSANLDVEIGKLEM